MTERLLRGCGRCFITAMTARLQQRFGAGDGLRGGFGGELRLEAVI